MARITIENGDKTTVLEVTEAEIVLERRPSLPQTDTFQSVLLPPAWAFRITGHLSDGTASYTETYLIASKSKSKTKGRKSAKKKGK